MTRQTLGGSWWVNSWWFRASPVKENPVGLSYHLPLCVNSHCTDQYQGRIKDFVKGGGGQGLLKDRPVGFSKMTSKKEYSLLSQPVLEKNLSYTFLH